MDKRFPIEDQIDMLAYALKGRIVTARDADYDALRVVPLANFDHRPAAVIRVANAADVAAVLNFAQATDLPVAIRSGGHSTIGGSGVEGGLVIDLRDINAIDIDAASKTAWIGAGLTAAEVSAAVTQRNLIIGFGDAGTVGVGGLTLGGGIGYMIRKHGLTIDSLLAAEIVTAAGDIIIADAANHPDLFWALRGGGGNFGVVTRFRFRLHDLPFFAGGPLVFAPTPEVLAGFAAASAAAPEELSTIGYVMPIPPVPFVPAASHGKLAFVAMLAYSGAPEGADAAIAPFRALGTPMADLVGPVPYTTLYMLDPPAEVKAGRRHPQPLCRRLWPRRGPGHAGGHDGLRCTHEDGADPRARRRLLARAGRRHGVCPSRRQGGGRRARHVWRRPRCRGPAGALGERCHRLDRAGERGRLCQLPRGRRRCRPRRGLSFTDLGAAAEGKADVRSGKCVPAQPEHPAGGVM